MLFFFDFACNMAVRERDTYRDLKMRKKTIGKVKKIETKSCLHGDSKTK